MSFDTDPREDQDAEMYAAFAAKDKRIAELETQLSKTASLLEAMQQLAQIKSEREDRMAQLAAQAGQERGAYAGCEVCTCPPEVCQSQLLKVRTDELALKDARTRVIELEAELENAIQLIATLRRVMQWRNQYD